MMTQKQWLRINENIFTFIVDENEVGNLAFHYGSLDRKAIATIDSKRYEIRRTGFWKNNIEISDEEGKVVMTVGSEKWYVNTSVLEYKNAEYQLVIRNNPLAEWVIMENETEVLAYGLGLDNGKAILKITGEFANDDFLPDFLLWYLFVPIAQENITGNMQAKMMSGPV